MKPSLILLLIFITSSIRAQKMISVIDTDTREPVAYAAFTQNGDTITYTVSMEATGGDGFSSIFVGFAIPDGLTFVKKGKKEVPVYKTFKSFFNYEEELKKAEKELNGPDDRFKELIAYKKRKEGESHG